MPKWLHQVTFPPACITRLRFPYIFANTFSVFLVIAIPVAVKWCLAVGLMGQMRLGIWPQRFLVVTS